MKKLETKYRNDELSPAELQELRNRIKSMSDYEIGEEMYQTWMNEKIDVTSVPDKQIDKIKAQIENSIKEEKSNGFDFSRIIQIYYCLYSLYFPAICIMRTDKLPPKK